MSCFLIHLPYTTSFREMLAWRICIMKTFEALTVHENRKPCLYQAMTAFESMKRDFCAPDLNSETLDEPSFTS